MGVPVDFDDKCGDCKYHGSEDAAGTKFSIHYCYLYPRQVGRMSHSPACRHFKMGVKKE